MSWTLEKKQRSRFNFTEYCQRGSLMKCLARNAALIINAVTSASKIDKCGVTDTLSQITVST